MLKIFRDFMFLYLIVAICFAYLGQAEAQNDKFPSAEESDPVALGWMQGFPPRPNKLIMQPQSNYFSFPKLRWTVCHIRELMPTEQVSRGIGSPIPLEYSLDNSIDSVKFSPLGGGNSMTWAESLATNYTDGF